MLLEFSMSIILMKKGKRIKEEILIEKLNIVNNDISSSINDNSIIIIQKIKSLMNIENNIFSSDKKSFNSIMFI